MNKYRMISAALICCFVMPLGCAQTRSAYPEILTAEIRWFFNGAVPKGIEEWYGKGLPGTLAEQSKPREDIYFLWPERDEVGLKLREGRLELKIRSHSEGFSSGDERISGLQEVWEKERWDYSEDDDNQVVRSFLAEDLRGLRIKVTKTRQQRKYEFNENGTLTPVPMRKRGDRVAIIELTELTVDGKHAWSLAFDIIGPADEIDSLRAQALETLLADYPGPALTSDNSFGYPGWLLQKP